MFAGRFGEAGAEAVIEEFMEGEEASFFALTDGATIVPFASAQDHKRVQAGRIEVDHERRKRTEIGKVSIVAEADPHLDRGQCRAHSLVAGGAIAGF